MAARLSLEAVEVVVEVVAGSDHLLDHHPAIWADIDLVVEVEVEWPLLPHAGLAPEEDLEVIVALHLQEAGSETEEEVEIEEGVHHLREEEAHEVVLGLR